MTYSEAALGDIAPEPLQTIRKLQRPGQPNVVLRVLNAYLESSPALLEELSRALADGDTQSIRLSAHTLKSSSAVLGAEKLAAISAQVEAHAREDNLNEISPLMPHLSTIYANTHEALLKLRDQEIE